MPQEFLLKPARSADYSDLIFALKMERSKALLYSKTKGD